MYDLPDANGHFGPYGGVFVAETLRAALDELTLAYSKYREDPEFQKELAWELEHYVGRPSPVYHARRLSSELGGAQIYLKREDLNHTGAHKVNNTVGQALLAKRHGQAARDRRDRRRASTASRPRRSRRATGWSAWSTWAARTCSARRRTSTA
jgi:tryptophan synthase beta chain